MLHVASEELCLSGVLSASADSPVPAVVTLDDGRDGRVTRGNALVLHCKQATDVGTHASGSGSGSSIVWWRRSAPDIQHQLGVENFLVAELGSTSRTAAPRVTITRQVRPRYIESNLTISGKLRSRDKFHLQWCLDQRLTCLGYLSVGMATEND